VVDNEDLQKAVRTNGLIDKVLAAGLPV